MKLTSLHVGFCDFIAHSKEGAKLMPVLRSLSSFVVVCSGVGGGGGGRLAAGINRVTECING